MKPSHQATIRLSFCFFILLSVIPILVLILLTFLVRCLGLRFGMVFIVFIMVMAVMFKDPLHKIFMMRGLGFCIRSIPKTNGCKELNKLWAGVWGGDMLLFGASDKAIGNLGSVARIGNMKTPYLQWVGGDFISWVKLNCNGYDVNTLDQIHWANRIVMWWVAFRKLRSRIHGLVSISSGSPIRKADYQLKLVIIISRSLPADITEGYSPTIPV